MALEKEEEPIREEEVVKQLKKKEKENKGRLLINNKAMITGYKTKIGVTILAIWGIVGLLFDKVDPATAWEYIVGALITYGIYDKVGRK